MESAQKSLSLASLIVVLGFPPLILYQFNKHILARSLDSLHFLFFQLIFFFAYHHLLNIPSLSTTVFKYLYEKTSPRSQLPKPKKNEIEKSNRASPSEIIKPRDVVKTSTKTSSVAVTPGSETDYSSLLNSMVVEILDLIDQKNVEWRLLYEDKNTDMRIYQNPSSDCCYKVVGTMNNTPETTYDMLADVTRRSEWDHLTQEGRILEVIGESTRIHYVRTKAIFPTSARDAVTLAHGTQLEDGRMVHVNKSIEHRSSPNEPGVIRLEVDCAGFVIEPMKGQPNKCYLTQIIDANPKGWIPRSVISLVSTRDIPTAFRNLNVQLNKMPRKSVARSFSQKHYIPKSSSSSSSSSSSFSSSSSSSSLSDYHSSVLDSHSKPIYTTPHERQIHFSEKPINEKNKSSVGRPGDAGGNKFWKSLVRTIMVMGNNTTGGSGKFIVAAVTYAVVIIFGIRRWRSKNSV